MRAALRSLALGLLQGPAELLPVSSSGHVAALPWLLGWGSPAGTARGARSSRSRCTPARRRAADRAAAERCGARLLAARALSLPPAVARAGARAPDRGAARDAGDARRRALAGVVGAGARRSRAAGRAARRAGRADGAALGLAQAAALIPGVSRTGATLAAARARGFAPRGRRAALPGGRLPVLLGARAEGRAAVQRRRAARTLAARRRLGAPRARHAARAPLARSVERRRPLAPWAAYRRALAAVLAVRHNRAPMSGAYAAPASTRARPTAASPRSSACCGRSTPAAPSRSVPLPGHYAAVLEVAPNLGIAVGTDGVGSKLIVAEQTGRYDTVGIDCIAMNVNDVICVGAEPIAVLDYLAVEQADPDVFAAIGAGLKARRRGRRASRSPAARSRCCPS